MLSFHLSFCSAPSHWTDLDERRRERGNKRVLQLRQQDQEFLNRLPFLDLKPLLSFCAQLDLTVCVGMSGLSIFSASTSSHRQPLQSPSRRCPPLPATQKRCPSPRRLRHSRMSPWHHKASNAQLDSGLSRLSPWPHQYKSSNLDSCMDRAQEVRHRKCHWRLCASFDQYGARE